MNSKNIFITINHLDDFNGLSNIRVGDSLVLKKDFNNFYDDEAIAVYNDENNKIGYVANSTCTVARGTASAGRIYDQIEDEINCIVNFILDNQLIAQIKI